jgi:hypothetical protein
MDPRIGTISEMRRKCPGDMLLTGQAVANEHRRMRTQTNGGFSNAVRTNCCQLLLPRLAKPTRKQTQVPGDQGQRLFRIPGRGRDNGFLLKKVAGTGKVRMKDLHTHPSRTKVQAEQSF